MANEGDLGACTLFLDLKLSGIASQRLLTMYSPRARPLL